MSRNQIRQKGITLIDLMVSITILGYVSIALGRSMINMSRNQWRNMAIAEMQTDALRMHSRMAVDLRKAGDGVRNLEVAGKSIVAHMASPPEGDFIIYFFSDENDNGEMDAEAGAEDLWKSYRLSEGQLLEEVWQSDNWPAIKNDANFLAPLGVPPDSATRISQKVHELGSPFTRIRKLEFTLSSSLSSFSTTEDGFAASRVQISLELEKKPMANSDRRFVYKKSIWVVLENVLTAPTS